jgi:flagellar motor switch protein FliN
MSLLPETNLSHSTRSANSLPRSESPEGAHPLALSELSVAPGGAGSPTSGALPIGGMVNPLHQVKTTLQVCVGSAVITVGELLNAKEHQVLVLDRSALQPVDLVLEGHVVARGQLVAVGSQFAVRLTELPVSLNTGFAGTP